MKTYALKTPQGYLATQGTHTWFESSPVGWALYTEPPVWLLASYQNAEIVEIP